ncbi:hypothetical protein FRC01_008926 [Tulasnella sp. 417]|nr:hypothetical protein FRC01_008926 [Tulasnella sp. 417]
MNIRLPRDCAHGNILMDGRALFPHGWHPQSLLTSRDGLHNAGFPSLREVEQLRYYFIDFGISSWNEDMTVGDIGQERAPELSETIPYDPYKLDVYILGMEYSKFFEARYREGEFGFLRPVIEFMTPKDPNERPSALQAYEMFKELRKTIRKPELSRRLQPPDPESPVSQLVREVWHTFSEYWWKRWGAKRMAGPLE